MHRHGHPVVVDAAAQLPPRENLRRFVEMGADLVVFSGGKALGGPQSTGLLIGRRDLVGSALLQMMDMDVHPLTWAPAGLVDRTRLRGTPLHGIGRGYKVGKEEVAGLLCALERFVHRDEAAQQHAWRQRLQAIAQALQAQGGAGLRLVLQEADGQQAVPLLHLHLDGAGQAPAQAAAALCRRLQARPLPVHLVEGRLDEGVVSVNPLALRPDDDGLLAEAIAQALQGG
jgi:L-seryl-tRNA(Ser) seleniumtransferase